MSNSSTIIALASPNGVGALSILRISGERAHQIVRLCIKEKEKFEKKSSNYISVYTFIDPATQKFIDEITAIKYDSPNSYTGEDMVEIICHGSKLIAASIIGTLKQNGVQLAGRGEFTQRAFFNGKIDLIKAENIKNLVECNNPIYQRINESVHKKRYKEILSSWKDIINEVLVIIETEIEFSYDVVIKDEEDKKNKEKIAFIKSSIEKEITIWKRIEQYQEGIKVVIAGPPNAGKSSLFNKIIGYDRVIVTSIPGTTRDTISEKVIIRGSEITLIDSAGIRDTKEEIEKKGIQRSLKEIEDAHIVIWVVGHEQTFIEPDVRIQDKVIVVINKIDLGTDIKKTDKPGVIRISIEKEINFYSLIESIEKRVEEISQQEIPEIISNKRQLQIAENINQLIIGATQHWDEKEKAAYFLYKILEEFEEYFGKRDKEQIYNKIFESFCIGK